MKRLHHDALLSPSSAILIGLAVACVAHYSYQGGAAVRSQAHEAASAVSCPVVEVPVVEVEDCSPPAAFGKEVSEPDVPGQRVPTLAPPRAEVDTTAVSNENGAVYVRVVAGGEEVDIDRP